MTIKTEKVGQTNSDPSDTRLQQVSGGTKLGLKKGALKVTTEKAATALASYIPSPNSVPTERLVQLVLLLGTAEIVDRLPDGAASKVGFTPERRNEFSGLSRFVSGEILGRDAVDIVSSIAPALVDALQNISADDINELAQDYSQETAAVKKQEVVEEAHAPARR